MPRALASASMLLALMVMLAWSPGDGKAERLFNGTDLSGWVAVNCAPKTFTVKDGEIRCTGKPTGVLRTAERFRNFVLEMEWMHEVPGGNAGLFVWSDPLPARGQPFTRSIEVQVMLTDDVKDAEGRLLYTGQGDIFSIHGATMVPDRPHPAGWARCLPSDRRTKPAGEWNHFTITCKGPKITLIFNGEKVLDANLDDWKEARKNPDGTPNKFSPALKDFARKGPIGFQGLHGKAQAPVHYRNLKIKVLE